jgi:hypothetical protein
MSEEHIEVTEAKRKKNRRKKKKSKTAVVANQENDNHGVATSDNGASAPPAKAIQLTTTTKTSVSLLTPQECLRQSLIGQGFTAEEIDHAMEIMWDKGLAYDEFDAVFKFLRFCGDMVEENDEGSAHEEKEPGDQGTVQTVSTEDAAGEGESMSNSPSLQDQDDDTESASKLSTSTARRTTMAEKLDMVARADKVTDAIFAITQWINKAAKPHEVRRRHCDP